MKVYYGKAVYNQNEIQASLKVLKDKSLTLIDGPSVKNLETKNGINLLNRGGKLKLSTNTSAPNKTEKSTKKRISLGLGRLIGLVLCATGMSSPVLLRPDCARDTQKNPYRCFDRNGLSKSLYENSFGELVFFE